MLERFRKQTRLPDKIVCWLSEEEYNGVVPHELRKFADDGFVEIGWTSNTFSFKKYEIFKEHGKDFVFLIDDDIYYEDSYIDDMYNAALSHKDNVICCYGSNMSYYYDSRRTPLLKNPSLSSSYDSFAVCFPPNVFPMEYFECADIRDSISPKSESVFMQSLCIKNNIPIYCLNDYYLEQPEFIPGSEETALSNENRKKTNNITKDAIVFKNLIREFGIGKKCCELFPKLKQEPEVVIKCEKKQKENIEGKADGKEKENKKPDKSDIVKKQKEADNAEKTKPAKQEEKKKVSDKENNKVQEKKNPKYEQGVSICITAYNSQDYIEECLDSVALQNWFKNHDNWEILLGIDGCEKTLLKMKDIMHKYRNLRVFMMDRNVGTYITSNTIMFNAKYSHLIRFDSDDIMLPNMVSSIMKIVSNNNKIDAVKYRCITFTEKEILDPNRYLEGSICIRKDKFVEYGGYMPWRCSSDSELKKRLDGVLKFHNIKKPLCKVRRDNKYSITKTESTNMESDYRKKNNEYINTKSSLNPKIKYVTASCKETYDCIHFIDKKRTEGISVCITAYNAQDYIEECLDSVAGQTWFKTHDNWEIIVGIDNCEKTFFKMNEIMHKYKNLRVLMMDSNMGTYVTSNTLVKSANYEYVMRFDSDDVMLPCMVEYGMQKVDENNIILFRFENFGELAHLRNRTNDVAHGVMLYHVGLFYKTGGYRDWRCSGDSDFIRRSEFCGYKIIKSDNVAFKRRMHENSLTTSKDTLLSETYVSLHGYLRKKYREIIKRNEIDKVVTVETVCNTYKEIILDKP